MAKLLSMKAQDEAVYYAAEAALLRAGGSVYTGRLIREVTQEDILSGSGDWIIETQDRKTHSFYFVPEPKAYPLNVAAITERVIAKVKNIPNWQRGG